MSARVVCELFDDEHDEPIFTYAATSIHQGIAWAKEIYWRYRGKRVRCRKFDLDQNLEDEVNVRL